MVDYPKQVDVRDAEMLKPRPKGLVVDRVEGISKVNICCDEGLPLPFRVLSVPQEGLRLPGRATAGAESFLTVVQKAVSLCQRA